MASNSRSSGTAASRYASALVALAAEAGVLPQIEQEIKSFQSLMVESTDLCVLLKSPLIGAAAQKAALAAIAQKAGFSKIMSNFLMVVAENRRLADMALILKSVEENLSVRRGEVRATVTSAMPMTAQQHQELGQSLTQSVGRPVVLDTKVDSSLIGGVTITMGSLMIDDSVKTKIERLARAMKNSTAKAA